jgi:hypothetical protein
MAVPAVLALGTVACQQLLGLGDYKDCSDPKILCDTVSDSSVPDVDVPDTSVDASRDADADVMLPPLPDGSSTSDWATFHMPHTPDGGILDGASLNQGGNPADLGQGRDPTNITVQADPMFPDASVAFDAVTSRVWLVETEQTLVSSFAAAQAKCAARKARLPSRIELISLLDPTIAGENGMIRREVGTYRVPEFWTSTVASRNPITFWVVDFKSGATKKTDGNAYGVLCVR